MILNAGCKIELTAMSTAPLVLMLRPLSGGAQQVNASFVQVEPPTSLRDYTDTFGNSCQRLILEAGPSTITATCTVAVADMIDADPQAGLMLVSGLPDEVLQYLLPSRYCPSDMMLADAQKIVGQALPGYGQVDAINQWIKRKVRYKYGVSNASTTALETLKKRKGVCRDFAHLGISLCRSLGMPARMVSGFLYELDPMDLHAWFEVYVGGRWFTIDPTQKEPRGNRIVLAYGRDAADIAFLSEYGPIQMGSLQAWVNLA
ncbi:transglutaminase family protein [Phragmitibacter flavus]|uniref:Transglutaminase family protein n=1 Tax=Phragmitibacter flavus TaxID=2576071 RepID=A0A5R8KBL1_9BACT|nr:transglutaminase family protein [Phragmitibacter flavus]TLD69704.1 transglutaminase family protein [Phragmitibacter flavus]